MTGEFGPAHSGVAEGEPEGAPLSMTVGTRKGPLCRDLSKARGGNAELGTENGVESGCMAPAALC